LKKILTLKLNIKSSLQSLVGVCGTEAAIMDEEFTYFYGVRYDGKIPKDMEELIIQPCVYAVFPNVVEAWKRLYSEWVPIIEKKKKQSECKGNFYFAAHWTAK
jgi:AraC family transcriptional regulator